MDSERDKKRMIIKRALVCFWSCDACHAIGWDSACQNKQKCGDYLYQLLKDWFKKED